MAVASRFQSWREAFLNVVQEPQAAAPLKAASLAEELKTWTACLTSAVVASCRQLGWIAAAKGHRLDESFPWGYFKMWMLDTNVGRFEKV